MLMMLIIIYIFLINNGKINIIDYGNSIKMLSNRYKDIKIKNKIKKNML